MLLRLYRIFALLLHVLLGIFLAFVITVLLRVSEYDTRFKTLVKWWLTRVCSILGIEITIIGSIPQQTVLYVANHISWLDIPILAAAVNPHFLSKAEIRKWPLIGWLAQKGGTLFIKRGNREAAESAKHEMQLSLLGVDGIPDHSVLFFPEGTTTNGMQLLRFRPRLFAVAIETETPIQPVVLHYVGEDQAVNLAVPFLGDQPILDSAWKTLGQKKIPVKIHFTTMIEDSQKYRRKELAAMSEAEVRSALCASISSP